MNCYLLFLYILYISTLLMNSTDSYLNRNNVKTMWMTHLGCFKMPTLSIASNKNYTFLDNQPKLCSRMCGNWKLFALQGSNCICMNTKPEKEITSNNCHQRCPVFSDKMYCGSYSNEATVYIHQQDSDKKFDKEGDCLIYKKRKVINNVCNDTFPVLCKTRHGIQVLQYASFFDAKLTCENYFGRLIVQEDKPERNHPTYWLGTFRQIIKDVEELTTSSRPLTEYVPKTTFDVNKNTNPITTTTTSSSTPITRVTGQTTQYGTFDENKVYQYQTLTSKTDYLVEPPEDKDKKNVFTCGLYCLILGLVLCFITILALVACLFQLRQQWHIIYHRSERANKTNESDEENEIESKPVYLDPANQAAVFHKRNLSKINHHVYDTAGTYVTARHTKEKHACLPGYQELNFGKSTSSEQYIRNVSTQCITGGNYSKPWGAAGGVTTDSKIDQTYSDPWGKDGQSSEYDRPTEISKGEKKSQFLNLISNWNKNQDNAYEESVIDVKGTLYDQPLKKGRNKLASDPWKNYRYNSTKSTSTGFLVSGRGLSVNKSETKDHEKNVAKREIKIPNVPATYDIQENIYATPETEHALDKNKHDNNTKGYKLKLGNKIRDKRNSVKSKLLRLSQSLKRVVPSTTELSGDGYEVPNTIRQSKSKSVWYDTDTDVSSPEKTTSKKKSFNYEFASPLQCNDSGRTPKDKKGKDDKPELLYDIASPIPGESEESRSLKTSEVIYFQPIG